MYDRDFCNLFFLTSYQPLQSEVLPRLANVMGVKSVLSSKMAIEQTSSSEHYYNKYAYANNDRNLRAEFRHAEYVFES